MKIAMAENLLTNNNKNNNVIKIRPETPSKKPKSSDGYVT